MKKIIASLLLVAFCSYCQAQAPTFVKPDKDTATIATQNTPLLTPADYGEFVEKILQEVPLKYADIIRQWWIQRITDRAKEFQAVRKKSN